MSLFTHIDNSFSKMLTGILGIKGTQSTPVQADMESVLMMLDVGQGGFSVASALCQASADNTIAGVNSKHNQFIYPTGYLVAAGSNTNASGGYSEKVHRILSASLVITFDAAGLVAFAGKTVTTTWRVITVGGNSVPICQETFTIGTPTTYRGYLYRLINYVPMLLNGMTLYVTTASDDGTNFPANTTCKLYVAAVQREIGSQLPF